MVIGVALGEACTIVLRGATQQILDEAERSLHDALCVLSQTVKETRVVYGKINVSYLKLLYMVNAIVIVIVHNGMSCADLLLNYSIRKKFSL